MTDKQHISLLLDAARARLNARDAAKRNTREWYMENVAARALFAHAMAIANRINLKVAA